MKIKMVVLALLVMLSAGACGGGGGSTTTTVSTAPPKRLSVVTTSAVLTDFLKVIAGEFVGLYSVVEAGVDPHGYEATSEDITELSKADLIFRNGAGFEPWLDKTLATTDTSGVVIDTSNGVQLRQELVNGNPVPDPHIWHSPVNARVMVNNVSNALAENDAANSFVYRRNHSAYNAQLDALERETRQSISPLPNKKIVTNHNAFGYFCADYGLTCAGAVTPTFAARVEPSPAEIAALASKIKTEKVTVVFTDSSLPVKSAEAVAKAAGVKVVLAPNALFADTLGPSGSETETYLGAERHNVAVLVNNLR